MKPTAILTLSVLLFAGCTFDGSGVPAPPPARDRLAEPLELALQPAACFLEVNDRALPLIGGTVRVRADLAGTLTLEAVDVHLGDVVVPAEDGRPELRFTDVRVSLPEPVAAQSEWSASGDAGFARVTTDVWLDWKIVAPSGEALPLATQRLEDLTLDLDVFDALDGHLTAVLYGEKPGVFWRWADILTLRDLVVDLRASQE
jgi:hypothetical protein